MVPKIVMAIPMVPITPVALLLPPMALKDKPEVMTYLSKITKKNIYIYIMFIIN